MKTETQLTEAMTTEPTDDDRARRLEVGIADLTALLVQLRMMCDSVCSTLEKAGQSSIDIQAMASHTITCQIQGLEVSRQAKLLVETKAAETPAAPQVSPRALH